MKLQWLLAFIPVGVALAWFEANPTLVFIASALHTPAIAITIQHQSFRGS